MKRLSILFALALAACASTSPSSAPTANRSTAPARAPALDDLLGFLPANAQMVMLIDVQALRTSELWTSRKAIAALIDAKLSGVVAACGFNPLEDLDSIAVGMQMSSKQGVFVMRGFERDRTIRCLEQYGLPNTTVTNDKGVLTLTNKSGSVNMLTFVDPTTLVMVGSSGPTAATLRAAVETDRPLRASRGFMASYEQLAPGSVMSIVVLPSFLDTFAAFGAVPLAMSSSLRVTSELELALHIQYASAAEAQAAATAFAPRVEQYAEMFYVAELKPAGATIEGRFRMDGAAFDEVWNLAAAAFAASFASSLPQDSVP